MTEYQKDQVLMFFKHTMPMETRRRLMAELPEAYNALVGQEVVRSQPVESVS